MEGLDLSSIGPASNEPEYFGKPTDYSGTNPISVETVAKFRYREIHFDPQLSNKNSANGLRGVSATTPGIPYAEFHVYDSAGERIQQGETTEAGLAIFDIPRKADTYTLKIFSRGFNDHLKVSVLEDIYLNLPYSISSSFTISEAQAANNSFGTSVSPYDLTNSPVFAEADESQSTKIEGGAFNILYQIYLTNKYIRIAIDKNNPADFADVNNWWVADKVSVYWKAGFNPYSYEDASATVGLSYYKPGERKLFILGGISGNVKTADTDHFDNSVILHEYGHFLEDVYSNTKSPGGSHNGNFVIDPRLAWSEGWANYLQSAVRSYFDANNDGTIPNEDHYSYYLDTFGYKNTALDNTGGLSIAFNLRESGEDAVMDNTVSHGPGNGNFREISVARTLYKATRSTGVSYAAGMNGGGVPFVDVWKTFAGEDKSGHNKGNPLSNSLKNTSSYPIPHSGLFNMLLYANTAVSKTNLDDIFTEERHIRDQSEYAQIVTAQGGTCTRTMSGTNEETLSYARSNQLRNNDFFLYYHNGGNSTMTLQYYQSSDAVDASAIMDLDLILYYGSYVYFEDVFRAAGQTSSYIPRQSRTLATSKGSAGARITESISLNELPAGYYMINVKINAYNKVSNRVNGVVTYDLKIGNNNLCP